MALTTRLICVLALAISAISELSAQVTLTSFPATEQMLTRENVGDATAKLVVSGTASTSTPLVLRVTGKNSSTETTMTASGAFTIEGVVPVRREQHTVQLLANGQVIATAERVLAGDTYIVVGQSNAIANYSMAAPDQDSFLRGFAANRDPYTWSLMQLTAVGEWAGRAASVLSKRHNVPVTVFNFAVGAEDIAFFRKNSPKPHPTDNTSIPIPAGSTLNNFETIRDNLTRAGSIGKVRGVWWAQGEADGYQFESVDYAGKLSAMVDEYQSSLGIDQLFGIQTRFNACTHPLPFVMSDQRDLSVRRDDVTFIASTNVRGNADNCHFAYYSPGADEFIGNRVLGTWLADVVSAKTYDVTPPLGESAFNPNIDSAAITGPREITMYFDKAGAQMAVTGSPWVDFRAEGYGQPVFPANVNPGKTPTGGRVSGNRVIITFSEDISDATGVSYLGHTGLNDDWVHNSDGRGAFTFYDFSVFPSDVVPGNFADAELSMSSPQQSATPGQDLVVDVVLRNTGTASLRDVVVNVTLPESQVGFKGESPPVTSKGDFDFFTGMWTIPAIGPGAEETVRLTYFIRDATDPIVFFGEVKAQSSQDEDSFSDNASAGGAAFATVREDDEARIVIGDRSRDCALSVDAVVSRCDVVNGTWSLTLLAGDVNTTDLTFSGVNGQQGGNWRVGENRAFSFDFASLKAANQLPLQVTATRVGDASCASQLSLAGPYSCTTQNTSGIFTPREEALALTVAPNPVAAGEPLRVLWPSELLSSSEVARMYDATGRQVWQGRASETSELPTQGLSGMYIVRVGSYVGRVLVR